MIIDFHTHLTEFFSDARQQQLSLTWERYIGRLDEDGIDQAVLLPIYASPDAVQAGFILGENMSMRDQVLGAGRHQERVIVFGNLDPRWGTNRPDTDWSVFLDWYREHGCRGIGEITANLPFDDPRVVNMFRQIGARNWPVVFHGTGFGPGVYGLQDEPGAPRLERLLQAVPGTNVVGHGPGFWAEIAGDISLQDKMGYPKGPVKQGGALPRLLCQYPNLFCDISAGSGFNGLSRDREFGTRFLDEFQDRILFATDVCSAGPAGKMPHLPYLRELLAEGELSQGAFEKITHLNALKLLGAG